MTNKSFGEILGTKCNLAILPVLHPNEVFTLDKIRPISSLELLENISQHTNIAFSVDSVLRVDSSNRLQKVSFRIYESLNLTTVAIAAKHHHFLRTLRHRNVSVGNSSLPIFVPFSHITNISTNRNIRFVLFWAWRLKFMFRFWLYEVQYVAKRSNTWQKDPTLGKKIQRLAKRSNAWQKRSNTWQKDNLNCK